VQPSYQGDLDGLCGIYAVVNSFRVLRLPDFDEEACFLRAVKHFPEALWKGTSLGELKKIAKNVATWATKQYRVPLKVVAPFKTTQFRTAQQWQAALDEYLVNGNRAPRAVAIVGILDDDFSHWTVVNRSTERSVTFFDSNEGIVIVRKSKFKIGAVAKKKWAIDPAETVIIQKLPSS
jgi:hypothetical protein